jgi:hypothetical protein
MPATIHDRLVAALTARGETLVPGRSTKYTVLTRTKRDTGESLGFYFVGRAGALRVGRTVTESIPVPEAVRARLLGEA